MCVTAHATGVRENREGPFFVRFLEGEVGTIGK